jgi:hypothetical protein
MEKNKKNYNMIFGMVICMFLGIIFIPGGVIIKIKHHNFMADAKSVEGVIADIECIAQKNIIPNRKREYTYIVKVRYIIDGKEYNSTISDDPVSLRTGSKITLYYKPDYPLDVRTEWGIRNIGTATIMVGIALFITGVIFWVQHKKKTRINDWPLMPAVQPTNVDTASNDCLDSDKESFTYHKKKLTLRTHGLWDEPDELINK